MDLKILSHTGLPFLLHRYKKRAGVPAGLLIALLINIYLSGGVWEIRVSGNETIGSEEILDIMEELGVSVGTRTRKIDVDEIETQIQSRLPKLSWIAVNIIGCKVFAEVREITEKPREIEEKGFSNIVAERDGVVVSADILRGSGSIVPGNAVVKGDLLISGVIELNNGACRFTDAKGIIKARTRSAVSGSSATKRTVNICEAQRDVYFVRFFGLKIPLGIGLKNAQETSDAIYAESLKTVFPIGIERVRYTVFTPETIELTDTENGLLCFAGYCEKAYKRYEKAEVVSEKISFASTGGKASVNGEYICIEDIGKRQPFEVE